MIILFTDFGYSGPYVGEVKAAILHECPGAQIVDLMHDAPHFASKPAAYLLAALAARFRAGTVCVGVVDPGVGGERAAVVVEADGRWFVGPDNGLFSIVGLRATRVRRWDIGWRPEPLSASFHGRDLFAPIAARIMRGDMSSCVERTESLGLPAGWTEDLAEAIYVDGYGNVMIGVRAACIKENAIIEIGAHTLHRARTFSDVPEGHAFWYENSCGLVEIAVNCGCAAELLEISVGDAAKIT